MAKKKVTLWMEPEYADKLEALARLEGLAISQYGAVLLERGIKQANDKVGLDLLETRLKLLLSQEFRQMTSALGSTLDYIGIQAGTSNLFLREDYQVKHGADEQVARNAEYRKIAFSEMKKHGKKTRKIEGRSGEAG